MPLITIISSAVMLNEPIRIIAVIGGALIIFGVYVSEHKSKKRYYK